MRRRKNLLRVEGGYRLVIYYVHWLDKVMIFSFEKCCNMLRKYSSPPTRNQNPTNSPTTMDGVKLEGNDTQFSIERDKFDIPRKPARRLRLYKWV